MASSGFLHVFHVKMSPSFVFSLKYEIIKFAMIFLADIDNEKERQERTEVGHKEGKEENKKLIKEKREDGHEVWKDRETDE